MGVLIYILIIVFIVVSTNNSKKKKAQSAGKTPQSPARVRETPSDKLANARTGGDFLKALGAMATESVEDMLSEAKPAAKAQAVPGAVRAVKVPGQSSPVFMAASPAAAPQGEGAADDEGCVGGSMAHTHDEGESRAEHDRHMKAAMRRETDESLAAQAAQELSEMNIHRLRRAVVVAEILDRPKALRRRAS
ncbi:MAG: hypothetical protein IJH86_09270 [Clostridia bacterium]|nr:hypothetical protein [Clostridia bacterium]